MKKIDFEKVIQLLSNALRCPVCEYQYNLERTKIIETKNDDQDHANLLVHSDCGRCRSSVLFNITINGPEVFSLNVVTDLTSADTKKFSNAEPINAKDVLNTHYFLNSFDGDLAKVLKK